MGLPSRPIHYVWLAGWAIALVAGLGWLWTSASAFLVGVILGGAIEAAVGTAAALNVRGLRAAFRGQPLLMTGFGVLLIVLPIAKLAG